MTLIVDTAPLVSLADAREPRREAVLAALRQDEGPLILPAPATAEVDHLLGPRFGPGAREAFLTDLASGRCTVACLELGDYATIVELDRRYADLGLSLVNSSTIILAARYRTSCWRAHTSPAVGSTSAYRVSDRRVRVSSYPTDPRQGRRRQ